MSKKIIRKKIEKKILRKKQPATETNISAIRCHTWTHSTLKITQGKQNLMKNYHTNYQPSVIDLYGMVQQA